MNKFQFSLKTRWEMEAICLRWKAWCTTVRERTGVRAEEEEVTEAAEAVRRRNSSRSGLSECVHRSSITSCAPWSPTLPSIRIPTPKISNSWLKRRDSLNASSRYCTLQTYSIHSATQIIIQFLVLSYATHTKKGLVSKCSSEMAPEYHATTRWRRRSGRRQWGRRSWLLIDQRQRPFDSVGVVVFVTAAENVGTARTTKPSTVDSSSSPESAPKPAHPEQCIGRTNSAGLCWRHYPFVGRFQRRR